MSELTESVWVESTFWHFTQLVRSQHESDSYTERKKAREMDVGRCNHVFKGKR